MFVKDFFDELRQDDFDVNEEEVEKLTAFADEDGQVTKDGFKTYCKHSELFQSLDKWVSYKGLVNLILNQESWKTGIGSGNDW